MPLPLEHASRSKVKKNKEKGSFFIKRVAFRNLHLKVLNKTRLTLKKLHEKFHLVITKGGELIMVLCRKALITKERFIDKIKNVYVIYRQKNFIYKNYDDSRMLVIYEPSRFLYLILMSIAFFLIILWVALFLLYHEYANELTSIFAGIIGGHIVAVSVAYFIDLKKCEEKTLKWMRFHKDYLSRLLSFCDDLIMRTMYFLGTYHYDEVARIELDDKEDPALTIGRPWETWCYTLQNIIESGREPSDSEVNNKFQFITQEAALFHSKLISVEYIDALEGVRDFYRDTVPGIYAQGYLNENQCLSVKEFCSNLTLFLNCMKNKNWPDFFCSLFQLLFCINEMTELFYSLKKLRETENIYRFSRQSVDHTFAHMEKLEEYLDIPTWHKEKYTRSEYRKLKKLKKYCKQIFEGGHEAM